MNDYGRTFRDGFTLMEILVVIVIVGTMASVAVPSYVTHIERVRSSEGVQMLTALLAAQERFRLENNNAYATAMASLDIDVPNSANFTVPPNLFNNAAKVATVARSDGTYTLCISSLGVVSCSGAAATCGQYAVGTCP